MKASEEVLVPEEDYQDVVACRYAEVEYDSGQAGIEFVGMGGVEPAPNGGGPFWKGGWPFWN